LKQINKFFALFDNIDDIIDTICENASNSCSILNKNNNYEIKISVPVKNIKEITFILKEKKKNQKEIINELDENYHILIKTINNLELKVKSLEEKNMKINNLEIKIKNLEEENTKLKNELKNIKNNLSNNNNAKIEQNFQHNSSNFNKGIQIRLSKNMINYDELNEKRAQEYFKYLFYEGLEKDFFSKKGLKRNYGSIDCMNSILQCLLHIPELNYYLFNIYNEFRKTNNKIIKNTETKGKISEEYFNILINIFDDSKKKIIKMILLRKNLLI
jgi:hypothetical protein